MEEAKELSIANSENENNVNDNTVNENTVNENTVNENNVNEAAKKSARSKRLTMLFAVGVCVLPLLLGLFIASGAGTTPAAILVDGEPIVAVKSADLAEKLIADYLEEKSAIVENTVYFAEDVTVSTDILPDSKVTNRWAAADVLDVSTTLHARGAAIVVDGETLCCVASERTALNLLEYLKLSYLPDDSTMRVLDAKFAQNVQIQPCDVRVADTLDMNEAKLLLKGVDAEEPPVTVLAVIEKTKVEEVPFETRYEVDSSMRNGETKTKREGANGSREVTIQMVQTNGVETARQEISSNTLVEATEAIVLTGAVVQTASRSTAYVTDLGMIWPTTATRISSYYGYRGDNHSGIDIDGETGDPVWAAKTGTVTAAGYKGTYGNQVVIDHGNGVQTRYAHMDSVTVSVGDEVAIGQQVGVEGSTGNSTGSHLHFEVIINGNHTDPLPYIR